MNTSSRRNLGEYELLEQLGRGPNCAVWRSRRKGREPEVALKVLDRRYADDARRCSRFVAEADLARSLEHPHIVRVHDIITTDSSPQPFFTMDLLPGGTIGGQKAPAGSELARLIRMLGAVCSALDYIHSKGLVHCDVKASNVLLDAERTHPFLADFGMAASPEEIEQDGSRGGTIVCMSPEQFLSFAGDCSDGPVVDCRSDIYSLGVLMYHVLTGHLPFSGSNRYSLLYQRMLSDPPPVSRFRDDLPAELEAIIQRAMHRNPDHRFQTASELADALAAVQFP